MTSRRLSCAAAAACAASLLTVSAVESRVVRPDDTVHLSGCLVRMDNGNGYLLTNGPNDVSEPALAEGERYVAPGAAGTDDATIFYWLDDDDGLKVHVGHRVQIKGERKGDVKEGGIELDRKDNWTELTVKADGRTGRAHLSNPPVAAPDKTARKGRILVKHVDVDNVKMVRADCQ